MIVTRALLALTVFVILGLLVSSGRKPVAAAEPVKPRRHVLDGVVTRYAGLGPERWARRYRIEHRRWRLEQAHRIRLARALRRVRTVQVHESASSALPAHYTAWLCIHRYEGAWDANTGNGYYGGLQFDITFQQMYGAELLAAKGTADRWSPLEQMQVAERAYQSGRGFYPWPTTARMCGLL